jgi:hypothetical protein
MEKIPIEGALLKELRVFGNGKDCCIRLETSEPDVTVHFDMRDPAFEIDLQGRVQTVIFNEGSDRDLGVKYLPMERLRVQSFVVDYPGTQHAWQTVLKAIREGNEDPFDWMLDTAKLKLVPGD